MDCFTLEKFVLVVICTFAFLRWIFTPTEDEKEAILAKFGDLTIPDNFSQTSPAYDVQQPKDLHNLSQPKPTLNPQTKTFCDKLGIDDPIQILMATHKDSNRSILNETDNTNNSQTFVDTDLETSLPLNNSLGKLNLPEPKLGSFIIDGECGYEQHIVGNIAEQDAKCGRDMSEIESFSTDNKKELEKEEVEDESVSTRPKKLIRRNADIYKSECD